MTCTRCHTDKPLSEFGTTGYYKGEHRRRSDCRECRNDAKTLRRAERRAALQEIVRKAKQAPCTDCGQRFPYYAMDLDHVRGEKRYNVARLVSQGTCSIATLKGEIAKCEVVCAVCHRLRHGRWYEEHTVIEDNIRDLALAAVPT